MSMIPDPKYHSFGSLPAWARNAILEFCSDDGESWVVKPIPALDDKSFLEAINSPDGEAKVRMYFQKVIGKF